MATIQMMENDTQVVTISCHVADGSTRIVSTNPATTMTLAATDRFHSSKATVANEATTTAPMAAMVYS